jgi:hypothetical protein
VCQWYVAFRLLAMPVKKRALEDDDADSEGHLDRLGVGSGDSVSGA